jgi:hypothetical protein
MKDPLLLPILLTGFICIATVLILVKERAAEKQHRADMAEIQRRHKFRHALDHGGKNL